MDTDERHHLEALRAVHGKWPVNIKFLIEGEEEVGLVLRGVDGRAQRAQQLGVEAPLTRLAAGAPDEVLRPHAEIISPLEVQVGLHTPVSQYAVIENALRAAAGQARLPQPQAC